jgi:PAS domain S-box-containing protein
MRGIMDSGAFLQPANAMDLVETILEASEEYSIIGEGMDGTILLWNEGARRLYGYEPEEVVGKVNSSILISPDDSANGLPQQMRRAALADGKWAGTVTRVRRDGSRFPARLVITPRRNRDGEPIGLLLISKDISDQVRLAKEEEQFRGLLESAPDAMVIVDSEGKIALVNRQTEQLFGYQRQELLGQPIELLVPERFHDRHVRHRSGFVAQPGVRPMGAGLQLFGRRKDASEFPVEISLSPLETDQGTLVSAAVRDITARKQAEEQFRGLLESAPDAMVIVDSEGKIALVNRQTEQLFGYQRQELLGQPIETLVPKRFHRRHISHRSGYVAQPGVRPMGAGLQLFGRRKDASEFPVEISLSPLETDQGTLVSAAVRDIASRKQVEEALQQAMLAAEQANLAKSEYLSRMSHELRTPLNAILGFAQLLEMEGLRDDQREGLGHILAGARHLLTLINEVLDIAAIEAGRLPLSLEAVAVADVLAEAISLIRPLADQQSILLVDQPQTCACHVLGDRQRLKQILLNLLSNAVKYNRDGGSVQVACEQLADERLQIKVTDTGVGIPAEAFERLFVPFDRLGSDQTSIEGTGLGLPLSKRLVEAMGGTLGVASTVGQGSSFWIELPLTEAPVQHLERTEPLPTHDHSRRNQSPLTVLYIEDNLSNLQLVEHVLTRRRSVKLISAMRPQLGLDLANQHHPDLVLLDLDLPDMPGEEVLRRLRAEPETAGVPVVILSADARPGLVTRLLEEGARAFLTKPLDVKELLAVLDTIAAEQEQAGSWPTTS